MLIVLYNPITLPKGNANSYIFETQMAVCYIPVPHSSSYYGASQCLRYPSVESESCSFQLMYCANASLCGCPSHCQVPSQTEVSLLGSQHFSVLRRPFIRHQQILLIIRAHCFFHLYFLQLRTALKLQCRTKYVFMSPQMLKCRQHMYKNTPLHGTLDSHIQYSHTLQSILCCREKEKELHWTLL